MSVNNDSVNNVRQKQVKRRYRFYSRLQTFIYSSLFTEMVEIYKQQNNIIVSTKNLY